MNNNSSSESVIDRCADNSLSISKYEEYVCVVIGFSVRRYGLLSPVVDTKPRYPLELADIVEDEHRAFTAPVGADSISCAPEGVPSRGRLGPDLEPFDHRKAQASSRRSLGAVEMEIASARRLNRSRGAAGRFLMT